MNTFNSNGKSIRVELFRPAAGGLHPAIVVAYGTEGLEVFDGIDVGAAIRDYAGYLAERGFVVLLPHYFERTNTSPGFKSVLPVNADHRDEWQDTLGDCLSYAATLTADVNKTKMGLLGFSLGGLLALRQAKCGKGKAVGAVVEFSAPINIPPQGLDLGDKIENLPPVQIHHGKADKVVPPTQSLELEGLLEANGVQHELHYYKGEGHVFRGASAIKESKELTAEFFNKHLA